MYNHNKAQQSKNRVYISWDILYILQHQSPVGLDRGRRGSECHCFYPILPATDLFHICAKQKKLTLGTDDFKA